MHMQASWCFHSGELYRRKGAPCFTRRTCVQGAKNKKVTLEWTKSDGKRFGQFLNISGNQPVFLICASFVAQYDR